MEIKNKPYRVEVTKGSKPPEGFTQVNGIKFWNDWLENSQGVSMTTKKTVTDEQRLCADMWSVISGINLHNQRAWENKDDGEYVRKSLLEIEKLTHEAWATLIEIQKKLGV